MVQATTKIRSCKTYCNCNNHIFQLTILIIICITVDRLTDTVKYFVYHNINNENQFSCVEYYTVSVCI